MTYGGETAPVGSLELVKITADGKRIPQHLNAPDAPSVFPDLKASDILKHGFPQKGLSEEVNLWRKGNAWTIGRSWLNLRRAMKRGFPVAIGSLYLRKLLASGEEIDFGLAGLRVVTDAGVAYIVDAFQNTVEVENMKFHGFGTGTTAEAASQTALVTELTTQYATDSTRPTGTTVEGASANIYRTVATVTPDSGHPIAVTEHGVFSANAAGVLLDRTKFTAINLDTAGDAIQATYELTLTSGS